MGGRAPFSLRAPPARPPPPAPRRPPRRRPSRRPGARKRRGCSSRTTRPTPSSPPTTARSAAARRRRGGAAAGWPRAPSSSTTAAAPPRSSRSLLAYRDLSADADGPRAAAVLFETLRWAERQADGGARVILLPDLGGDDDEHVPALADRLYRAASGERAAVGADGVLAGDADAVLARASALELCQFFLTA